MADRRHANGEYRTAEGDFGGSGAPFRWYRDEVAPGLTLTQQRLESRSWTSISHDASGASVIGWYTDSAAEGLRRARRWVVAHHDELLAINWRRSGEALQNDTAVTEWVKRLEVARDRGDRA